MKWGSRLSCLIQIIIAHTIPAKIRISIVKKRGKLISSRYIIVSVAVIFPLVIGSKNVHNFSFSGGLLSKVMKK